MNFTPYLLGSLRLPDSVPCGLWDLSEPLGLSFLTYKMASIIPPQGSVQ